MSMWFISCHTVCAYKRYTQMYNKEFVGVYLHGLLVGVVHVRLALGYHLTGQLVEKVRIMRDAGGDDDSEGI